MASTSNRGSRSVDLAASRCCSSTANSPAPGCGSDYLGYFAARGWEGHALNLRNHFWSQTADPATLSFDTYTEDVVATLGRFGSGVVVVGHGMGGLLALKAAERMPISGLVLLSAELPRELRVPARQHELREIPEVYGKALIGWETLPERLLRDDRDLTLPDVLRIQHLLGQKPHEAGAAHAARCWPASRSTGDASRGAEAGHRGRPRSDRHAGQIRNALAEWLDAGYEPFAAHSHYGLVVGETSHQQVADAIRGFLEANRL